LRSIGLPVVSHVCRFVQDVFCARHACAGERHHHSEQRPCQKCGALYLYGARWVWRLVRSASSGCGRKGRHVSFDRLQEIVHNMLQRSFRRATRKHLYSGVLHLYVEKNGHDTTVGQGPMGWRCAPASSASTLARLPSPRIATAHWHTLAWRRGRTRLAEGPPPRRDLCDRGEDLYDPQHL